MSAPEDALASALESLDWKDVDNATMTELAAMVDGALKTRGYQITPVPPAWDGYPRTEFSARSEAEAVMATVLLDDVNGFPVPTEDELIRRVMEQLERRGYRLAPILPRRRVFVPVADRGLFGDGTTRYLWLWVPSGHTTWHPSATEPPTKDEGWTMAFREEIETDGD